MSEATGPITSLEMLMAQACYFSLQPAEAARVLAWVYAAVQHCALWR
jgi:hypothetical protein